MQGFKKECAGTVLRTCMETAGSGRIWVEETCANGCSVSGSTAICVR